MAWWGARLWLWSPAEAEGVVADADVSIAEPGPGTWPYRIEPQLEQEPRPRRLVIRERCIASMFLKRRRSMVFLRGIFAGHPHRIGYLTALIITVS